MFSVFKRYVFVLQCNAFVVTVLSDEPNRTKTEPRTRVGRPQTS